MKIEQKNNAKRPLYATGTALLASTMILSSCSLTTPTTTTTELYLEGEPTMYEEDHSSGVVDGCRYEILQRQEYGPKFAKGWYKRNSDGERYILVSDGMKYEGGFYLDITDISYDSADNTVVITVTASRDREVETDAFTYPCCSVVFDRIPNKVKVKYDDGTVIEYGGVINDTEVWGLNIDIDENYTAIFYGGVHLTYIYELEDGKYRYIHAQKEHSTQHPDQELFVLGSGIADNIYGVEYVCRTFDSFGTVVVKGDEDNVIDAEEYIKSVGGEETQST
jgi:hypothetical protein